MARLKSTIYFLILFLTPLLYFIVNRKEVYSFLSEYPFLLIISLIVIPVIFLINAIFLLLILIAIVHAYIKNRLRRIKAFGVICQYENQPLSIATGKRYAGLFAIAYCPECGEQFDIKKDNAEGMHSLFCLECNKEHKLTHKGKQISYNEAAYRIIKKLQRI